MDPIKDEEVESRKVTLNLQKKKLGINKLLIFDLDETLAHCVRQETPENKPDIHLDIKLANGKVLKAGFNVRPHTYEMLEELNKYYEIAVFTAS
jgi:TFIIF-interacting CTD phosphatase-like protein